MQQHGFGQPGERESTQHGVVNDITVPRLRLQSIILCDEIMIAAGMLLLPIGATLLKAWVLPVFAFIVTALLFRHALDDAQTPHEAFVKLGYAGAMCLIAFFVSALFRNAVSNRLLSAWSALWQWPPLVGLFLSRIAFLLIPFFIPIFTRTPLLSNFFKSTLQDPTWPSPRTARDVEGLQSPDYYDEPERETPSVTFPIMSLLRKNNRSAAMGLGDWFSPEKDADGLGKFGKGILEGAATFSEKGSKKTSKNPKLGALYYGYTQKEYVLLKKIGLDLELIEKNGVGHILTDKGKEAMVTAIIKTLGVDAVPGDYEYLI
jgi:hypothetical protein